jgi:hypothetical protein
MDKNVALPDIETIDKIREEDKIVICTKEKTVRLIEYKDLLKDIEERFKNKLDIW